mgnify:CR=1 FL=1
MRASPVITAGSEVVSDVRDVVNLGCLDHARDGRAEPGQGVREVVATEVDDGLPGLRRSGRPDIEVPEADRTRHGPSALDGVGLRLGVGAELFLGLRVFEV